MMILMLTTDTGDMYEVAMHVLSLICCESCDNDDTDSLYDDTEDDN